MINLRSRACTGVALGWLAAVLVTPPTPVRAAAPTDIAIRATAASFKVGTTGRYSISVTNAGTVNTDEEVRMVATLPAGLDFVSGDGSGWSCDGAGANVECSTPGIPAQTTTTLRLTVSVCTEAFPSISTAFTVVYNGDQNPNNNTTRRTNSVKPGTCTRAGTTPTQPPPAPGTPTPTRTPSVAAADLLLTKIGVGSFTIGSEPAYNLSVFNLAGETTNAPITLTDTLPGGIGFVSAAGDGWSCSVARSTVTCTNPNPLPVGVATDLLLTVHVMSAAYPSVTNTAVASYAAEIDPSDNTARRPTTVKRPRRGGSAQPARTPTPTRTPTGQAPTRTPTRTPTSILGHATFTDLSLTKSTAGLFRVGRIGVYTFTVVNFGPAATNVPVTIIDTLPDSLTFVSASGDGWSCDADGQTVRCTTGDPVAPNSATRLRMSVMVGEGAFPTIRNTAIVSYPADLDLTNNTARRPTTVKR